MVTFVPVGTHAYKRNRGKSLFIAENDKYICITLILQVFDVVQAKQGKNTYYKQYFKLLIITKPDFYNINSQKPVLKRCKHLQHKIYLVLPNNTDIQSFLRRKTGISVTFTNKTINKKVLGTAYCKNQRNLNIINIFTTKLNSNNT